MREEQKPESCGDCPCLDDCDINIVEYDSPKCLGTLEEHFKQGE